MAVSNGPVRGKMSPLVLFCILLVSVYLGEHSLNYLFTYTDVRARFSADGSYLGWSWRIPQGAASAHPSYTRGVFSFSTDLVSIASTATSSTFSLGTHSLQVIEPSPFAYLPTDGELRLMQSQYATDGGDTGAPLAVAETRTAEELFAVMQRTYHTHFPTMGWSTRALMRKEGYTSRDPSLASRLVMDPGIHTVYRLQGEGFRGFAQLYEQSLVVVDVVAVPTGDSLRLRFEGVDEEGVRAFLGTLTVHP